MKISFFEEFPTKNNIAKLKFVPWETKVYLAAESINKFLDLEKDILKKYPQVTEVVYWPTLPIKEGYWISPWSDSLALKKLFSELIEEQARRRKNRISLNVMLDLEPPKKRIQMFQRFFSFSKNRKLIIEFLVLAQEKGIKVYNIEMSHLPESIVWFLGLGYSPKAFGHKNIAMYYRSMLAKLVGQFIAKKRFSKKVRKFVHRKMTIGIGLIAPGIHETERCYGAKELAEDLLECKRAGASEVIIFRLGGMNQEMQEACENYI